MRPAVEHGGLIFLAILLCGVAYVGFPDWNRLGLFYLLFWGLMGLRVFVERATGPEDQWVLRSWSLVAAGVILFVYLSRRDWIGLYTAFHRESYTPWVLVIRTPLLGVAFPAMLWFHLRAVGRRSGSLLLGWLTSFLFIAYLPIAGSFELTLPHLSLGRNINENPLVFAVSYAYCLGDYAIEAWGLATLLEFAVVMKFWRSRPFRDLRLRDWESSLPFAVALLGAPFAGMRFVSGYFFRFFGTESNLEHLLPYYLLPAAALSLGVGLWLASAALPRGGAGKRSRRDVVVLAVAAFLLVVPFDNAFRVTPLPAFAGVNVFLIWGFCAVAGLADLKAARRGSLDDEAAAAEHEERTGFREFVRVFRSSSLAATSRSSRVPLWLLPFLVWGVILAVSVGVFPILLRKGQFLFGLDRLLIDPNSVGSSSVRQVVGLHTFQLFCVATLLCCVIFPAILLIPWRIAGRFPRSWNTARIRDAWMANIPPWRIFWGAILAPIRRLLVLVSGSILFLAGCSLVLFFGLIGGRLGIKEWVYSRAEVGVFIGVLCVLCAMLTGLGIILFVVGSSRRKGLRGSAVYAFAVVSQVLFWIGTAVLFGNTFLENGAVFPILAAFALWFLILGRWAFGGVSEAVQKMAGE